MQKKETYGAWHIRVAQSTMAREPLLTQYWSYDYGVIWNGMASLYELTGDEAYFRYIKDGMDSFLRPEGNRIRGYGAEDYNLDHLNNGKQLLYLYEKTGEARYVSAVRLLLGQLHGQPRTKEGGFWHKKIYPEQMWLDGLYMSAPFYAGAARLFKEDGWLDDIARQFLLIREHTRDAGTNLCRHAWDSARAQPWADPETGCSRHVWGRAMGWYLAALTDTLELFPGEHPGRGPLLALLRELIGAVWYARDPHTQVWLQVLDAPGRPGNYPESSCTSLFLYATAKAMRLGLITEEKREELRSAYAGAVAQFIEVLHGQAIVTKCCQVAGLGGEQNRDGSFAYYMSEPIIANDLKGTGAFIQAAAEMEGYALHH